MLLTVNSVCYEMRAYHSANCLSIKSTISNETFVSILQFLTYQSAAAWGKFQTIFFLSHGISPVQLGIMSSFSTCAKFFGYPLWAMIADITQNFKYTLLSSIFLSNAMIIALFHPSINVYLFDVNHFYALVFIRCLRSFSNAIWTLTDSITLALIQEKKSYGKYRLFASIAFGSGSFITGYLIDKLGIRAIFLFHVFWNMIFIIFVVGWMPNIQLSVKNKQSMKEDMNEINIHQISENDGSSETEITNNDFSISRMLSWSALFNQIWALCRNVQFLCTVLIIMMYACAMNIHEQMIYIQMEEEFQTKRVFMGLCVVVATAAEYPFFYFSQYFIDRYNANSIVFVCHIILLVRNIGYSFISSPSMIWLYLVLQSLHGINFALMWSAMRLYFHQMGKMHSTSDMNIQSTANSLLSIIWTTTHGFSFMLWTCVYHYYSMNMVYYMSCLLLIPSCILLSRTYKCNKYLFNIHRL